MNYETRLPDIIENLESAADRQYWDSMQPDGRMKCGCGELFDPESEGGPISLNPYAMPVCGKCLERAMNHD